MHAVETTPLSQDDLGSLAKLADCPPLAKFSNGPQLYSFSREKNGWCDFKRSNVKIALLNGLVGGTIFALVGTALAQGASTKKASIIWWFWAGIGGVCILAGIPMMFMRETLEVSKAMNVLLRTTFNLFRYKRERLRLSELRFVWVHTVIGFEETRGDIDDHPSDREEVERKTANVFVVRDHGPLISLGQGDPMEAFRFTTLLGGATGLAVRTSEHRMNQPPCPVCGGHAWYDSKSKRCWKCPEQEPQIFRGTQ